MLYILSLPSDFSCTKLEIFCQLDRINLTLHQSPCCPHLTKAWSRATSSSTLYIRLTHNDQIYCGEWMRYPYWCHFLSIFWLSLTTNFCLCPIVTTTPSLIVVDFPCTIFILRSHGWLYFARWSFEYLGDDKIPIFTRGTCAYCGQANSDLKVFDKTFFNLHVAHFLVLEKLISTHGRFKLSIKTKNIVWILNLDRFGSHEERWRMRDKSLIKIEEWKNNVKERNRKEN